MRKKVCEHTGDNILGFLLTECSRCMGALGKALDERSVMAKKYVHIITAGFSFLWTKKNENSKVYLYTYITKLMLGKRVTFISEKQNK